MSDTLVLLDEVLRCPHGHVVHGFQTKSFADPSMVTYLLIGNGLQRVIRESLDDREDAAQHWRIEGNEAVFERRHQLEPVTPPREVDIYSHCVECEPILERSDRGTFLGDFVHEHRLWVDFRITFRPDQPRQIERMSGTREQLMAELRQQGYRLLRDDEPLAIAHREIAAARERAPSALRR